MLNTNSILRIKIVIFILLGGCFCLSCKPTDLQKPPSDNLSENQIIDKQEQTEIVRQITKSSIIDSADTQTINSNQNSFSEPTINRPYQAKARRKNIKFPDDCQKVASIGDEYLLERTCADALYQIQPDLPEANCDYEKLRRADGHFSFDDYKSVEFYPLSPNKYLVQMKCWYSAYNEANVYLFYDEGAIPASAKVLEFPTFKFDYNSETGEVTDVKRNTDKSIAGRYFNPKTKELIAFDILRGVGDAGRYARYSFPNDNPKLEEYRAKFKMDGNGTGDEIIESPPKNWKRYYP